MSQRQIRCAVIAFGVGITGAKSLLAFLILPLLENSDMSKKIKLEVKARIFSNEDDAFVYSFQHLEGDATIREKRESINRLFDSLKKNVRMTYLNGWFLDDNNGEMKCAYCGESTKGFDYGKRNEFTEHFRPHEQPCKCRSDIKKCWCGKKATHECAECSSLCCGAPLCEEHECTAVGHSLKKTIGSPW